MKFELTQDDLKKVAAFKKKQEKITGGKYGAIGGGYTYHFTPTGLGCIVTVENCVTKAVLDLTDYDNW
jgi:hypothetical protein